MSFECGGVQSTDRVPPDFVAIIVDWAVFHLPDIICALCVCLCVCADGSLDAQTAHTFLFLWQPINSAVYL